MKIITAVLSLSLLGSVAGCGDVEEATPGVEDTSGFEQFRRASAHVVDGKEVYTVEWDLVLTLDELRDYYQRYVVGGGVAATTSTVDRINGQDNVWPTSNGQLHLKFCVGENFVTETFRNQVIGDVLAAAAAWQAQTPNVHFDFIDHRNDNPDNGSCDEWNPKFDFVVKRYEGGPSGFIAQAPFHHNHLEVPLTINYANIHAPSTSVGVFKHELGHVLGLKHEHMRINASGSTCHDTRPELAALTAYDKFSVMHYPQCGGDTTSDFHITALDQEGVQSLYGPRPARPLLDSEFLGCNSPHSPRWDISWGVSRGVAPTSFEVEYAPTANGTYHTLPHGAALHAPYFGSEGIRTYFRARACNTAGCSSYATTSVKEDCHPLP